MSFIFFRTTNAQTWRALHGEECVVLNVTQFNQSPGEEINKIAWGNIEFDNVTDCEKYYKYNYDYYPFENKFTGYKGWLETKYRCVSCLLVYGNAQKSNSDEKNKEGSKINNDKVARGAENCFNQDKVLFNDFLNAIKKVNNDIYLDKISCNGSMFYPEWSKRDNSGNKIPLNGSDRASIDKFYSEMQERAKARKIHELAKQLKNAQTAKEAEALFNTVKDIVGEIKHNKKTSENSGSQNTNGSEVYKNNTLSKEIKSVDETRADGTKIITIDTDGDGIADTKMTKQPGQPPVYEPILTNESPGKSRSNLKSYDAEDGARIVEKLDDNGNVLSRVKVYDDYEVVERIDGSATYRFDADHDGKIEYELQVSPEGEVSEKSNQLASSKRLNPVEYFQEDKSQEGKSLNSSNLSKKSTAPVKKTAEHSLNDNPEFNYSVLSKLANAAASLSDVNYDKELKALNSFKNAVEYFKAVGNIFQFRNDPQNFEKATDSYNAVASIAASTVSKASGAMYDRTIAPLPKTLYDTFDAGFDQMNNLLNNREVDENAALKPVVSYIEKVTLGEMIFNFIFHKSQN